MKHFLTIVFVVFVSCRLQAQSLEITVQQAGTLSGMISDDQRAGLKELVLSGVADARDFHFMNEQLPALSKIDMSGLQIFAYEPEDAVADEIPAFAFCDEKSQTGKSTLSSVIFPTGLKSVGESAFGNCKNLRRIDFLANTELEKIGASAFSYCMRLTEFTLPASLQQIGKAAFSNCSQLKDVDFSSASSLTVIDDWAFNFCIRLGVFDLTPTSLTRIGENAFAACVGLTSVALPASLEEVGLNIFLGCTKLSEVDFSRCERMEFLGGSAFYNCGSLHSIQLPPSLRRIGGSSFQGCKSLAKLMFPATLSSVGDWAFAGCTALKNIHCEATEPPATGLSAFDEPGKADCALYVPDAVDNLYKQNPAWSAFNILPLSMSGLETSDAHVLRLRLEAGVLSIRSERPVKQAEVFDAAGRCIVVTQLNDTDCRIRLSDCAPYLLCRVTFADGKTQVVRTAR